MVNVIVSLMINWWLVDGKFNGQLPDILMVKRWFIDGSVDG